MLKHIPKSYLIFLILLALPLKGLCQLPSPKWVDDIGGSGNVKAAGMTTDNQNNIYVTGYFIGTVDFDPSAGVTNLTSVGGYDTYVAKYTPAGALVWAVSMGGNGLDQANYLTVDNNGNPTITGQFQSAIFNAGAFSLLNQGAEDVFTVHLNTNGAILWAKSIGGSGTDRGEEVNADIQGNVIVTSIFQSSVSLGSTTISASGGAFNGLIIKYDASGNVLWNINLGTTGDTEVYGNGIDNNGNIIVSGCYNGSVDFDPLGVHHIVNAGPNNEFIAKYTSAGKLIWVSSMLGTFIGNQSIVSIDSNNDIYITGAFSYSATFNGSTTLNSSGSQDTFLAKYSSAGTFQFAKDIGGSGASSFPYQIRTDKNNNVYVTGYFSGTIDFNPDPAATANVTYNGQTDLYLSKYDANGNYQWAFGGGNASCNSTVGEELSIDNNNDILLAGTFCQTVDFDPSSCATYNVTAQSPQFDTYIAKYVQSTAVIGQITGFAIPQQISPAIIDQANHTINVTVAWDTNVASLTPTLTVSSGTLSPASGTVQNFTSPVVYTLSSGCTSTPYTVKVILAAAPKIVTVCAGTSNIVIGDVVNTPPDSYNWQVFQNNAWINAPGIINNKDYQTSVLQNNTGANIVFNLRREVTTQGIINYDSFNNVTVQPATVISGNVLTAPLPSTFCSAYQPNTAGAGFVIVGGIPIGGNGTYSYQWQSSTNNITFTNIAGATSGDYTLTSVNVTTYYRRVVTSGTCVAPSISNVISIVIQPDLTNNVITAPVVTSFCSPGNAAVITGSIPSGGNAIYNFQWQSSADNSTFDDIPGAISKDFDPPALNSTIYYRRVITSGACITPLLSNVVTMVITNSPLTPVFADPITNICINNTATLSISSPQPGVIYDWYDSTIKTNHLFTGIAYITGPLTTDQVYYVEATSGACASQLTSVQVHVNGIPATPLISGNPTTACSGTILTLNVSNPQTGIVYNWYTTPANGNLVFSGTEFVTPALTADITYYVEAVNNGGCTSVSRSPVNIQINPLPVANAQGTAICPGTSTFLTANNNDPNVTINWYVTTTSDNILFTGNIFTTPVLNTDTYYYVEAVDNTTQCVSNVRDQVQVHILQPLAAPVVTVKSTSVSSVTFQWEQVSGATGYLVSIDNGQTFTDPSSGNNGLTHTISGLQLEQSVTIIVRANGSLPCALSNNSTAITGTALNPLGDQIFVPNAFTPNGDGKNDIVYVHSSEIRSLKFYVYDQWGELLYTSLNPNNGWDGTYKGTKEPVGVYVYYLEAIMSDGQKVNKKGMITLLR